MKHNVDELSLQRLVDGVLTDVERGKFLRSLDAHPEAWREVALAFVEEQVWTDLIHSRNGDQSALRRRARRYGEPGMRWWHALALAACLVVMLTAGTWIGQWSARRQITAGTHGGQQPNGAPAHVENAGVAVPENLGTRSVFVPDRLELVYGQGASRQAMEVPVVHESQIAEKVWGEPYIVEMDQINRKLASLGYRIDWQTEYLEGDLSESRQLVVPVRAISLQPRGQ